MDHPSGDGPNTWLVSKVTKEAGITMALSGLGGDELFAGYPVFKRMMSLSGKQWLWRLPAGIRKVLGASLTSVKPGVSSLKIKELLSMKEFNFASAYSISRQALMDDQIVGLLNRDTLPEHNPVKYLDEIFQSNLFSSHRGDERRADVINKVSIGELTTYMQNVLLRDSDQMSMAHALEVRVPFLDHELVEFILSLPDKFKYPSTPKKLLVDSLNDILPDYIVNRPKMGFVFPWRDWLKNELHSFADERINSIAEREYFNKKEVINLWARFKKNEPAVTFSRIWPLIVLEEWMRGVQGTRFRG
jgi:asparagine synthase (glutamine-hydrolysing)